MGTLPEVTITSTDRQRLVGIAKAALASDPDGLGAAMLLGEIARATIVPPESLSPGVVDMNSEFEVRDNIKETTDVLRIVYPDQQTSRETVSVLTPLGAALIGLSEGASMEWCTKAKDRRSLTVLRVRHAEPVKRR